MTEDVKRIVEGLRFCAYEVACTGCMADDFCCGEDDIKNRAADLIEQLTAELEQVRRERDAAIYDLTEHGQNCHTCRHYDKTVNDDPCANCRGGYIEEHWQWRGVQENGGAE